MGLPNLSYMMKVGQIRHIQARYEAAAARNPDTMVWHFLTPAERLGCALRGLFLLKRLRRNPFYYYALARTRYYDELFARAICGNAGFIINIGCGGDTRAYRWREQLIKHRVAMIECDQPIAIEEKEKVARRALIADHVQYLSIDLNDAHWPAFNQRLDSLAGKHGFVMMEGVSPYVDADAFEAFLTLLASKLEPGSEIAYDYKILGLADKFGHTEGRNKPFRLGSDATEAQGFHARLGLVQRHHELGSNLLDRLINSALLQDQGRFDEDALVQCVVGE